MKFFELLKDDYEYIVDQCMLSDDYAELLKYHIKKYSRTKISTIMNKSESALDVMTADLKRKVKKLYENQLK